MRLTKDLAEAIVKLRPYPSFQLFVDAIFQDQAATMNDLVNAPSEHVGRLQGRAQCAREIIEAVTAGADKLLEKISKQPPGEDGNARSTRISSTSRGTI